MPKSRLLTAAAVVIGIALIVVAIVYWIEPARSLPGVFLVGTHLATALVLLGFFWRDWVRIVKGLGRSLRDREIDDPDAKLAWLLIVGTIPAGILGLTLEHKLRHLFTSAESASIFLMA